MPCPRCDGPLDPALVSRRAQIHACAEHGGFVGGPDLAHAIPVAAHARLADAWHHAPEADIACPSCASAMRAVRYRDVDLDACPTCEGVWFDEGELERVRAKTAPDGQSAAPKGAMGLSGGAAPGSAALDPVAWGGLFSLLSFDW